MRNKFINSLWTAGNGITDVVKQGNNIMSKNRSVVLTIFCSVLLALFFTACINGTKDPLNNSLSSQEVNEDWTLLFDGSSLDGWTLITPGTWTVSRGTIAHDEDAGGGSRGMIWSSEKYGNFILQCEFKIESGCNSGIFFRVGDKNSPVQTGFEMQVIDSFARPVTGPRATHNCGALYDIVAPSHNAAKPAGEWNKAVITCKENIISISLNGDKVVSAVNLDMYTEANLNIDGTTNKFNLPLKEFPRSGHIGFQQHGGMVWYRNIKLKELQP